MSMNLISASRQGVKEEALPQEKGLITWMTLEGSSHPFEMHSGAVCSTCKHRARPGYHVRVSGTPNSLLWNARIAVAVNS